MAVAGMYCKQQRDEDKSGNVSLGRVNECNNLALCYVCVCVFPCVSIQYLCSLGCWILEAGVQADSVRARMSRQGVLTYEPCRDIENIYRRYINDIGA